MTARVSLQDQLTGNHCFGCGPENAQGLRIKSYWSDVPGEVICEFQAQKHHNAGTAKILNGGIIATVLDCHCVITAIAQAYKDAGREVGQGEAIWFVTGSFDLRYQAPALLAAPVFLTARVTESWEKKSIISCDLKSGDIVCTTATMTAIRVPPEWHDV